MDSFSKAAEGAVQFYRSNANDEVLLFHHNDADGLTAGSITYRALERDGKKIRRYSIEKTYPEVLREIAKDPNLSSDAFVIFTDFASGVLPTIVDLFPSTNNILILDHHKISPVDAPNLFLLNCLEHGISGGLECSASSVAFKFAYTLSKDNTDLSVPAFLGAIGDSHFNDDGKLVGVNNESFEVAKELGLAEYSSEYYVQLGERYRATEIVDYLNSLGSFGYLKGGPDIALKGLAEGFDQRYTDNATKFKEEYNAALVTLLSNLELNSSEYLQWFFLGEEFNEMGVKTVGLLCEELMKRELCDPDKYIVGFQKIPSLIPGIGLLPMNQYKVSMRVPAPLFSKVKEGREPSLAEFLPDAAAGLGGLVDGCHPHAGAVTVELGIEDRLIEELNKGVYVWKEAKDK